MKIKSLKSILTESMDLEEENPHYEKIMRNFPYDRQKRTSNLPVSVKKEKWSILENPRRMLRRYELESAKEVLFFLRNLLDYENRFNHHATHKIQEFTVEVEVRTNDLDDITKNDVRYAKNAEKIFRDIEAIRASRNERNRLQKENIDYTLR